VRKPGCKVGTYVLSSCDKHLCAVRVHSWKARASAAAVKAAATASYVSDQDSRVSLVMDRRSPLHSVSSPSCVAGRDCQSSPL
jgi:hypothetical protein